MGTPALLLCIGAFAWLSFTAHCQETRKQVVLGQNDWGSDAGKPVIRIGAPLTLGHGSLFKLMECLDSRYAYELFVNMVNNERGGIMVGGQKHLLELILVDDKENGDDAASAMQYLVEDLGLKHVLGPQTSALNIPCAPIANRSGAVMVTGMGASPKIFSGHPRTFGTLPGAPFWKQPGLRALAAKGAKTIAIVSERSGLMGAFEFGIGLVLDELNMTVLKTIKGPEAWDDGFDDAVQELKELDADVVVSNLYRLGDFNFVKALRAAGYLPRMLMIGDQLGGTFTDFPPDTYRFMMQFSIWNHEAPFTSEPWAPGWSATSFGERYMKYYGGKAPSWQAASAWSAIEAMVRAIEAANSTDPNRIVEQLNIIDINTLFGKVTFGAGRVNVMQVSFVQYNAVSESPLFVAPMTPEHPAGLIYPMPKWEDRKCILTSPERSVYGYNEAGQCLECPHVATFKDDEQRRICVSCPIGYDAVPYLGEYQRGFYGEIPQRICKKTCPPGQALGADDECSPCEAGSFEIEGRCYDCPEGTYTSMAGVPSSCNSCGLGKFAAASGMSVCQSCAAGKVAADQGLSECTNCTKGYYAAQPQSVECDRCERGRFQEQPGATMCSKCKHGKITQFYGSYSSENCECAPGTFLARSEKNGEPHCDLCLEALYCPGGNGAPRQRAGYATGPVEYEGGVPTYMVKCASRKKCPSDTPLNSCPAHREGVGCDICEPNYFPGEGDECRPCSDNLGVIPILLTLTVAAFIAGALTVFASKGATMIHSQNALTVTLSVGMILLVLQTLGAFSELSIDWIEPITSLKQVLKLLSFEVDMLNLGCIFQNNAPSLGYFYSLTPIPIFSGLLLVVFGIAKKLKWKVNGDNIFNALGLVVFALYLGLSIRALGPYQCASNPDQTSSLAWSRGVLCWESADHQAMVGMSALAILLYVVGPLVMVAWATFQYPVKITRPGGISFVNKFRFIFDRFSVECYWYPRVYMLRNLLISIMPIVLVNNAVLQVLCLALVIIATYFSQVRVWPWRTSMVNHLDAVTSSCVLLMLCAGMILLEVGTDDGQIAVQVFIVVMMVLSFGTALVILFFSISRLLLRGKPFAIFLCHYKLAAAVFCRWLKIMLAERSESPVFLDSDELDRLDLIFDVVAHQTRNLAVAMNAETPSRPWCAGEMASAVRASVPIVIIACEDAKPLTDDFINNCGKIWTDAQKTDLAALGMTVDQIQTGFRAIQGMESIHFDRGLAEQDQEAIFENIFVKFVGLRKRNRLSFQQRRQPGQDNIEAAPIAIMGNLDDAETSTICFVMRRLLQEKLQISIVVCGRSDEYELPRKLGHAKYLLAVLTKGCLCAANFASALLFAQQLPELAIVPLNADRSFVYPSDEFWPKLMAGEIVHAAAINQSGFGLADVAKAYQALFTVLALTVNPHGSMAIIQAQVLEMIVRFRDINIELSAEAVEARKQKVIIYPGADSNLATKDFGNVGQAPVSLSNQPKGLDLYI